MPFPDACSAGVFDLLHYIQSSEERPDKSLIDKYDDWMDKQLETIGYSKDDPLRNSRLRLGFLGEEGENGQRRTKRVPGIKKPREKKPPRERDEFNLIKGTKKSYVWELTAKGFDIDRIIRRMKRSSLKQTRNLLIFGIGWQRGISMVKLKESNIGPILPDRYYIWTWRPDTTNKIITEKKLYRKHLTGIPYFTRHHVKVTLVYLYGVDVLQYIHIISGRKLLQQGIRELSDMNGKLLKRGATKFWFKGKFVRAKKFIIPDEYKIDKHRRRRFMVQMHRVFKSKGKKAFDERYSIKLYGQRQGISPAYTKQKRLQIYSSILQDLREAESRGEG